LLCFQQRKSRNNWFQVGSHCFGQPDFKCLCLLAELALGKEFFVAVFNFLKSAGVQRLNFALLEEGLAHEFDLRAESVDLVLEVLRVRVFE
jgi:hypothetical protein